MGDEINNCMACNADEVLIMLQPDNEPNDSNLANYCTGIKGDAEKQQAVEQALMIIDVIHSLLKCDLQDCIRSGSTPQLQKAILDKTDLIDFNATKIILLTT